MKRGFFLFIFFTLILAGLTAEEEWRGDADRADRYFRAGDYDAAWLFYERALVQGSDDGLIIYRAAESFRLQELTDNPEFGNALYAVARHFLQDQYPDDPALTDSENYIDENMVVNRRFLRQTYAVIGAKAPKARRPVTEGVGSITGFFVSRIEELGQLFLIIKSEGIREGSSWAKERAWRLLLSLLIVNAVTGIILPVVMAVTVAREGRKSYVTAYAFLLHWGPLGIHRFYLGRYVSGFIWLFTGGLLGLGVFFDLFLTGAYIRFWNEDHRGERPAHRPRSTGTIRQPKVKRVKTPRAPKPPRAPKVPKAPKTPNVSKSKSSRKTSSDIDTSEKFAFGAAVGAAAASPVESVEPVESDDDFGDLPDLSFDDDVSDDFSVPSVSEDDEFTSELPEELSDDDFDIKSLE